MSAQLLDRGGVRTACLATMRWKHSEQRLLLAFRFWPLSLLSDLGYHAIDASAIEADDFDFKACEPPDPPQAPLAPPTGHADHDTSRYGGKPWEALGSGGLYTNSKSFSNANPP